MNKKHRMILAGICAVLILVGVSVCLIVIWKERRQAKQSENGKHYVAVITKSTDSNFFQMVFSGAKAAATEFNLKITMDGPQKEEDYETQNQMIDKAVRTGAEVIVFSASDFEGNAKAIDDAIRQGVKVIVIDSDVNSSKVSCRISTNNYNAGMMAGRAMLESPEQELRIGLVNFDRNSANGQQREQGFLDVVKKDPRVTTIHKINVLSNIQDARDKTIDMINNFPKINAIATFNEWTSLGVGYAVQKLNLGAQINVVAFDSNVVSVGMLETGEVDALIVQNPYAMGYLGIEYANSLINGSPIEKKDVDTATTLITRKNMFEENSQKVLFSMDQ